MTRTRTAAAMIAAVAGAVSMQVAVGPARAQDADKGKQTLVTLLGVEGARVEAGKRARRAVEALGPYAARAPELSVLPFFLLDRDA